MSKIKEIYIKIGRRFFELDENLTIQELDNGYIFGGKYYKTINELLVDFKKALEGHLGQ